MDLLYSGFSVRGPNFCEFYESDLISQILMLYVLYSYIFAQYIFIAAEADTDISILKYCKRKVEAALLDPKGPLSNEVPSISIAEANKEVVKILYENQQAKKGLYIKEISKVYHGTW